MRNDEDGKGLTVGPIALHARAQAEKLNRNLKAATLAQVALAANYWGRRFFGERIHFGLWVNISPRISESDLDIKRGSG